MESWASVAFFLAQSPRAQSAAAPAAVSPGARFTGGCRAKPAARSCETVPPRFRARLHQHGQDRLCDRHPADPSSAGPLSASFCAEHLLRPCDHARRDQISPVSYEAALERHLRSRLWCGPRRLRPLPIAARSPSISGFYREKPGRERVNRGKTECDRSSGIRLLPL
jgi:hypothetical protein